MNTIRIEIVEDHAVYRNALRSMIEQQPDLEVIAEAVNGLAAIEIADQHKPDVILMDVSLPGLDGITATRVISSKFPQIKVIVLTLFTDDGTMLQAREAGAYHCFAKDGALSGLLAGIRSCRPPT